MRKTEFWTVLGFSALALAIHLAVNAFGGYGYFRDELYYIACSKHPAAGYVDQPPLSLYILAGVRLLFGDSVFAIRLVNAYVRYTGALGVEPGSSEGNELAELPQFFADMHGWEELASNVSAAFLTIPEAERATTVAFVTNYGEAGALELYARRYPLPRVICNHNAYWFWGTGGTPITTFIRLGGNREDYLDTYDDVVQVGVHTCAYCMPYENHQNILIARHRRTPIETAWAEYQNFHGEHHGCV